MRNRVLHGDSAKLDESSGARDLYGEAICDYLDGDTRAMQIISDFCMEKAKMIVKGYNGIDYQDIAQEALFQVHKSAREYNEKKSSGRSWISTIVTNKYRDALRRKPKIQICSLNRRVLSRNNEETSTEHIESATSKEPSPSESLEKYEEERIKISDIEKKLDMFERSKESKCLVRIFRLRRISDLGITETANATERPEGTIKAQFIE